MQREANTLAEKHLIKAIGEKYSKMGRKKRVETIRALSADGAKFIRKFFPDLYEEAFPRPSREASASSESDSRPALSAKSR
jgi:hypothetical protein